MLEYHTSKIIYFYMITKYIQTNFKKSEQFTVLTTRNNTNKYNCRLKYHLKNICDQNCKYLTSVSIRSIILTQKSVYRKMNAASK